MRRTLVGLVAVGTLVVGACGDDDDSSDGEGASPAEFCATMEDLVVAATNDDADPEAAEETLSDLEPPEEIADEWDEYVPLITGGNDIDPNDPEAQAEHQEELREASEAGRTINRYLTEECGISGEGESETPTSETTEESGD